MDRRNLLDVANLKRSEEFLREFYDIESAEVLLTEFLHDWQYEWCNFDDIADDVRDKIDLVLEQLNLKCRVDKLEDLLRVSVECIILIKLHNYIVPLIHYQYNDDDDYFYNKCKNLSRRKVTAEQLGAPNDYAIPLSAAVVELASMDGQNSSVEMVRCLCATYDLVFAELKSAMIQKISRSADKDNEIPVIENNHIIPVLMVVIVRAKVLHLRSNMYYVEKFLWKLKESENVMTTITVFKTTIEKICTVSEEDLQPGCEKVCRDLDLRKVMEIMTELEVKRKKQENSESLLDQHTERVSDLIYASTFANIT